MVSVHATKRGMQRIKNNSYKKNKEANIKKIMRKDAYRRYFAWFQTRDRYFRYVDKEGKVYKYVIDKFSGRIITTHEVDFEKELKHYPYMTFRK